MARQRRGGGFRPPELRGTLGTLLRTTLAQAGSLRDVLERGAREGRSRLDSALSGRRRQDALAELGDIVLDLIRRGEIDLGELPEVRDIVAHLDEIDAGAIDDDHGDHGADDERFAAPPVRNRFDARSSASPSRGAGGGTGGGTRAGGSTRGRERDEDGTVSSRTWARPSSAKPQPRVWRPPVDDSTADANAADDDADTGAGAGAAGGGAARGSRARHARPADEITAVERPAPSRMSGGRAASSRRTADESPPDRPSRRSAEEMTTPSRPAARKDPTRKGGIHFDDDEDLAEYMHPDDVPAKTPPDGDS